nr:uncharacterized protein LOC123494409 [Aegilops tauschii subsp. strangulata]
MDEENSVAAADFAGLSTHFRGRKRIQRREASWAIRSMQDKMMDLMDVEKCMQRMMLWKLIWTSNQTQSHRTSNQTRRLIFILSLTNLLHQLVMQQSRQTGSRRMKWDCLQCHTPQFVPQN